MTKSEEEKKQSYHKKKSYIKKSEQDLTTSTSSRPVNRLDMVRWGQDGWILDYLNEHIFKGLMRDFDKFNEDDEVFSISPAVLFQFYTEAIDDGFLSSPATSIDLKKAKQFAQRPLSEKQLFNVIKKVGDCRFKGNVVLPKIKNLNTGEEIQIRIPQKDLPIFTWLMFEKQKTRGKKTIKHYDYYLVLTTLGIYLMLTASAFWNVDFLPKALYRLDDGCNNFSRSIIGLRSHGRVEFSYLKVRDRLGIKPHKNPSVEREHVEIKLNHIKNAQVIEDWNIKGGEKKYRKNKDIVYQFMLSKRNWNKRKNLAKRKAREEMMKKMLHEQGKLLTEKDN